MGTQYCLKWNNHQTNMLTGFDKLLSSESFVDVTLACDGFSLKAHKVVLSAFSPFFQALFLENPCKHPIVIMRDTNYADLKAVVDFMYRGEILVPPDQLSELLKTAEVLKVKGLAEVIVNNTQNEMESFEQQEITQQTVNDTAQSVTSREMHFEIGTAMLKRRKHGNKLRRSSRLSNRSAFEVQTKIEPESSGPDSPGADDTFDTESNNNTDQNFAYINHPQFQISAETPTTSSPCTAPARLQQSTQTEDDEETQLDQEDSYYIEPTKIMKQIMTSESSPIYLDSVPQDQTSGSTQISIPIAVRLIDIPPLYKALNHGDGQALVPCSMPSEPFNSRSVSQHNIENQDIKPQVQELYEQQQQQQQQQPPSPTAEQPLNQQSSSSLMDFLEASTMSITNRLQMAGNSSITQQEPKGIQVYPVMQKERRTPHGPRSRKGKKKSARCSICNRVFFDKSTLNRHLECHSAERKKFKCHICDRTYARMTFLQSHLKTHDGALPYSCRLCTKAFGTSSELKMHVATKHLKNAKVKNPV